jgi:hypothetical protein
VRRARAANESYEAEGCGNDDRNGDCSRDTQPREHLHGLPV